MCYLGFCAINRKTNSSLVKWTENSTPRQEHLKLFIQDCGFTVNGPIYMCCVGWRKLGEPWGNSWEREGKVRTPPPPPPPPRDTKERQQGQWWEITVSFINIFTAQTSLLVCFFSSPGVLMKPVNERMWELGRSFKHRTSPASQKSHNLRTFPKYAT